jgi:hypothetical protein
MANRQHVLAAIPAPERSLFLATVKLAQQVGADPATNGTRIVSTTIRQSNAQGEPLSVGEWSRQTIVQNSDWLVKIAKRDKDISKNGSGVVRITFGNGYDALVAIDCEEFPKEISEINRVGVVVCVSTVDDDDDSTRLKYRGVLNPSDSIFEHLQACIEGGRHEQDIRIYIHTDVNPWTTLDESIERTEIYRVKTNRNDPFSMGRMEHMVPLEEQLQATGKVGKLEGGIKSAAKNASPKKTAKNTLAAASEAPPAAAVTKAAPPAAVAHDTPGEDSQHRFKFSRKEYILISKAFKGKWSKFEVRRAERICKAANGKLSKHDITVNDPKFTDKQVKKAKRIYKAAKAALKKDNINPPAMHKRSLEGSLGESGSDYNTDDADADLWSDGDVDDWDSSSLTETSSGGAVPTELAGLRLDMRQYIAMPLSTYENSGNSQILNIAAPGTMKGLFSPCTRLLDLLESQGRLAPRREGLQELNLDVSTEDLLSAEMAFTYEDLYAMLGNRNTIAWLTPHTAVARKGGREGGRGVKLWGHLHKSCRFHFNVDGDEIFAFGRSPEHLLEICDVVLRLLAASVVHSLILVGSWNSPAGALINAPTWAYLMEQCQSLNGLTLKYLEMDENNCRVLGGYSRPGLEIELFRCNFTSAGTSALVEVLGRDQGPTKLDRCGFDNFVLANGLRGSSRLESFRPCLSDNIGVANQELLAIAGFLKENKGLVEFWLPRHGLRVTDETWGAICDSLKTHPTLEVLDLRVTYSDTEPPLAPAVIKFRMQALVNMLKVNMSIHTIRLPDQHHSEHELFQGSGIPFLETNRTYQLRPRVHAIQKTRNASTENEAQWTMERLFSPCTRLRDLLHDGLLEHDGLGLLENEDPDFELLQELEELNLDVSTEELLSAERAFTYADLYAMLGNDKTVAWLTPHAAVVRHGKGLDYLVGGYSMYGISFNVDGKEIDALVHTAEQLFEICDVVFRLLAASAVHSVIQKNWHCSDDRRLITAPTLAYLMDQCQSLKFLSLHQIHLDGDHCRVLGAYSRPDLEIVLTEIAMTDCNITGAGGASIAMAEVIGHNQGPTKLDHCDIDNCDLANGLRGNSRLKSFRSSISGNLGNGNREVLAIAGALRENKGLVDMNLICHDFNLNDETWDALCDSLKTHPTLEVLDISMNLYNTEPPLAPAVINSRIQALVNMLKVNMTMHTIRLPDKHHSEHELFQGSVITYIETNRTNQLRSRVRAIQKTRPIAYRAKVLGRALLEVRTDPNRFWMLLSGNAEVAFSSTTVTTTLAVNLPATATVGASANAATVVANPVATAAPAVNFATPASGQKRKACA